MAGAAQSAAVGIRRPDRPLGHQALSDFVNAQGARRHSKHYGLFVANLADFHFEPVARILRGYYTIDQTGGLTLLPVMRGTRLG